MIKQFIRIEDVQCYVPLFNYESVGPFLQVDKRKFIPITLSVSFRGADIDMPVLNYSAGKFSLLSIASLHQYDNQLPFDQMINISKILGFDLPMHKQSDYTLSFKTKCSLSIPYIDKEIITIDELYQVMTDLSDYSWIKLHYNQPHVSFTLPRSTQELQELIMRFQNF